MQAKFILLYLFSLILLICSITTFSAENKVNSAIEARTIAIAPYGIEKEGEQGGIYFDLMNSLLNSLAIEHNHYISPYARILHELKTGQTDITILFKYEELAPYVKYITPLPTLKNVVIGPRGKKLDSLDCLEGKIIAYLRGAKFSDDVDNNRKIHKQVVIDFTQGLKMLLTHRVDAIIGPLDPIKSAAAKLAIPEHYFGEPLVVSERTPWLQISLKSLHKFDLPLVQKKFDHIVSSQEFQNIKEKYQKY